MKEVNGVNVRIDREQFWVVNAHIERNEDGTSTASATIRGRYITVNYDSNTFRLPEYSLMDGKPWLKDARKDLCREFINRYGCNAHPVRERRIVKKVDDGMYVDLPFLWAIRDKIGISVSHADKGSAWILTVGSYEITRCRTAWTRKADLCHRLREQMAVIKRIQEDQKVVDEFFEEFAIA